MKATTESTALATSKKLARVQLCLADLQDRGMGNLVDTVTTFRCCDQPIIRLSGKPDHVEGCVVRIVKQSRSQTLVALHKGCQLRWEETAP
jgi:hypothetical protein